jgi:hypothetical protein
MIGLVGEAMPARPTGVSVFALELHFDLLHASSLAFALTRVPLMI